MPQQKAVKTKRGIGSQLMKSKDLEQFRSPRVVRDNERKPAPEEVIKKYDQE